MNELAKKEVKVNEVLSQYDQVLVAFSGGIDSTLVLDSALKVLGHNKVTAVVANSELFTNEEFDKAVKLAKDLGANVKTVELNYLANDEIKHNTPASWYWMKKIFYQKLNELKAELNADVVLDGMIMDDNNDFRPGLRARDEEKAVSILQQADIYKKEVRKIAASRGLVNWNKVASCSVSSRFSYNTELTLKAIKRVMDSEAYLRGLGFLTVRVRVQDLVARIEVPVEQTVNLINQMQEINQRLKNFGFEYVTVDLQGFKSGRMNEVLSDNQKAALVG
ncbi:MAG: ATP-dependent sacrificial sulfur transferase LarE [Liquorilactobacillus ghanensis]|uniref:ATP-dependent sacrificial sulfur transferase LarE n=1 Tax=Liquorilactobacillus ghanensis TaxID=399370 RepID=UPI0039E9338A